MLKEQLSDNEPNKVKIQLLPSIEETGNPKPEEVKQALAEEEKK